MLPLKYVSLRYILRIDVAYEMNINPNFMFVNMFLMFFDKYFAFLIECFTFTGKL